MVVPDLHQTIAVGAVADDVNEKSIESIIKMKQREKYHKMCANIKDLKINKTKIIFRQTKWQKREVIK